VKMQVSSHAILLLQVLFVGWPVYNSGFYLSIKLGFKLLEFET